MNLLWSMVDSQTIILLMTLWNINLPANASLLFGFIFQIATFDFLPTDDVWNWIFPNISRIYDMPSRFESLGFGVEFFIYNSGSMFFSFIAYLFMLPLRFLLRCLSKKFPRLKALDRRIDNQTFWSYPITLTT